MIKICGGEWSGRPIHVPTGRATRPTSAKVRAAIFNSLASQTPDACVLDLYAGSGCLGLEALSRGANSVTWVDDSNSAAKVIKKNMAEFKLRPPRAKLIQKPVAAVIGAKGRAKLGVKKFDLIFADPPYGTDWTNELENAEAWEALLDPDGVLVWEWGQQAKKDWKSPPTIGQLVKIREKHYGDTVLTHYARER